MKKLALVFALLLVVSLWGCATKGEQAKTTANKNTETAAPGAAPVNKGDEKAVPKAVPKEEVKKALTKVVVANPSQSVVFLPVYFAKDKGFYENEGLDAQVMEVKGDILASGLVAGEIDYGSAAGTILRVKLQGAPLKMVLYTALGTDFTMVSKPSINSPADLKGKVVASNNLGGTEYLALISTLKKFNVDPSEVTIMFLGGTEQRLAALYSGAIDAANLSPPYNVKAVQEFGLKELYPSGQLVKLPFAGAGVNEQKLANNPEEIKSVLRAMVKTMQHIKNPDNKTEVLDYIASRWKINQSGAEQVLKSYLGIMTGHGLVPEEAIAEDIKNSREEMKLEQSTLKPADVAELGLLREVLKELGIDAGNN